MKNIMNIALYGGAFDPPHKSHLSIIHQLLNIEFIDEVWLLPSGDRNDKKLILPMTKRFELMAKLLDDCQGRVKVTDLEIQLSKRKNRMIETYEMISELEGMYPMSKFYFVVGGDILSTIGTWGNAKQLLENVHFIVVPRKGYSLSSQIVPKKYYFCSYFPEQISSSEIKKVLLDSEKSKEEKYERVKDWLESPTLQMLREHEYI